MKIKNNLIIKRARLFAKMNECKLLRRRCPVVAYLLITDKCNLRCRYCFVDCNQKRKELSTSEWIDLINNLYAHGTNMVCFMGGEPLLHKDIDILVDHVLAKGMICDITTNGVLVPKKIDIIKKVDSLMVSVDGDREGNDANRGKGSFDKAIEAIRVARGAGVAVRINAVMTKQSKDSIDFLLDLADQYDLYVTFAITAEFPLGQKGREEEIMLSETEIKNLYKRLKVFRSKGRRVLFSPSTLDYVINYPLPYNKIILRGDKEHENYYTQMCPFGQTMFYVDSNGDFYPCAALWNGEYFTPKNVLIDSFQDAWENMTNLKCVTCFCPGVPEWNRIMSIKGLFSGVKLSLKQMAIKKTKEM